MHVCSWRSCSFPWQEADENGSDGLDIDEFKAAFGQILGKGKKDQQVHTHSVELEAEHCVVEDSESHLVL